MPAALGFVVRLFHWAVSSRYYSIPKNDLARAMVAQSEQPFLALAQGKGPAAPAVKILELALLNGPARDRTLK